MITKKWQNNMKTLDDRRNVIVPGNKEKTIDFCVQHFIDTAQDCINDHGIFSVALSGGSTPKAIFEKLAQPQKASQVDWSRVLLFWGDERSVLPTDPDSNYRMAMDAGLESLPIPPKNIFRMHAEKHIENNAISYEALIKTKIPSGIFDLVTLGMGDDGHTASLFPLTKALECSNKLVTENFIPQKDTWRMTLTYPCINASKNICFYVLGENKKDMLKQVLQGPFDPKNLPSQAIGSESTKALWIMDDLASKGLEI